MCNYFVVHFFEFFYAGPFGCFLICNMLDEKNKRLLTLIYNFGGLYIHPHTVAYAHSLHC